MRRLAVDAPPPGWLCDCPTAQGARPHWVLRDAALAPVVEVVGSRFLRRYGPDSDGASSKAVHWQLRFPRVTRWARIRARVRVRVRIRVRVRVRVRV